MPDMPWTVVRFDIENQFLFPQQFRVPIRVLVHQSAQCPAACPNPHPVQILIGPFHHSSIRFDVGRHTHHAAFTSSAGK